ncbi:hypothetical protein KIN20_017654 [Parelaphostrongylus tenuis]|uniref:Uncharacterized protein n=1 Tax=Parelaphostrongylus tenuis TaxID=148309 RepID=A0AAD5N2R9_PARTN|nr:hypothetical protein KIN20_017654 [Parelaphostrongylus tenuis]
MIHRYNIKWEPVQLCKFLKICSARVAELVIKSHRHQNVPSVLPGSSPLHPVRVGQLIRTFQSVIRSREIRHLAISTVSKTDRRLLLRLQSASSSLGGVRASLSVGLVPQG